MRLQTGVKICRFLEVFRWVNVGLALFFAHYLSVSPEEQLKIISIWIVIAVAGTTGVESVFLSKSAASLSGYSDSGAYQRQSGFNNLALSITALIVYFLAWGTYADLTVLSILLIFLTFSSLNHLFSAIKEGNKKFRNYLRPILTFALLAGVLPFVLAVING